MAGAYDVRANRHVRADASFEQRVPVVEQVMGGDGGGYVRPLGVAKFDCFFCGDVLHDNLEVRVLFDDWFQIPTRATIPEEEQRATSGGGGRG
jgi:hypothetical protein